MKYIELNTHHDGEKVIVRKDAIDCFYDDHDCMGSIICINSISLKVKETYEQLRYKLVDPLELQYMLQTSDEPIVHVCDGDKK